jgi:hypothetical protein
MSNVKHLHCPQGAFGSAQAQVFQISKLMLVIGLALAWAAPIGAQESELHLSLSKAWGFSMGGQVQGLFNLSVRDPQDITSVRFEWDGDEMATVTQPPFTLQFSTDKYPRGWHQLSATAQTASGRTLKSNTISVEFVSAEAGWQVAQRIIIPLLGITVLAILIGSLGQFFLTGRGKPRLEPGAPRNYGVEGGAICPKCGRPFARHFFSPNLLTGKLERCPYCGKWSIVPRAGRETLAAAEAAEREASKPAVPEASPEEKLRRQIEESRYQ